MQTDTDDQLYFVIHSRTSAHSPSGLMPRVTVAWGNTLHTAALHELSDAGLDLERFAGVENLEHGRDLTREEALRCSAAKLSDDGRLCLYFPVTRTGASSFFAAAASHGLREQAEEAAAPFFADSSDR